MARFNVRAFRVCAASFLFATVVSFLSGSAHAEHDDGRLLSSSTDWGVTGVPYWSSPNGPVDTSPGTLIFPVNGAVDFFGMDFTVPTGWTYLQFDLLLSSEWNGDDGPASFTLTSGGTELFSHTLSVIAESTQSYPTLGSPAGSGAFSPPNYYRFSFAFPAVNTEFGLSGDVDLEFRAIGPIVGSNASFAIDNFIASGFPIPEPNTALLLGLGLVGLARRARTAKLRSDPFHPPTRGA